MQLLGLDIGTKRTGVAFLSTDIGISMPLTTIMHSSDEELVSVVNALVKERAIERVIIGLPLLLSGEEGQQATYTRSIGTLLEKSGIDVVYTDERYSSNNPKELDKDAAAASKLLTAYVERYLD